MYVCVLNMLLHFPQCRLLSSQPVGKVEKEACKHLTIPECSQMPNLPKCLLGTEPRLVKGGTAAPERPRCGTQLCRDRARREQPGLNGMTSGVSSMKKCGDDSDSASHAYHTARLVHTRHSMNRMSKLALSTGSESFYFPKHKVDKDTIKIKKKQKQRND